MKALYLVAAAMMLAVTGCFNPFTRSQSPEESERERDLAVRNIGDVTEVANAGPLQVSGVGLVTGLDGTGDAPQGSFRKMLEEQLRKQKVEHVKAILDSPANALVLISAQIMPGTRKGDSIDVEVTLPPGSRVTSLRGGYLQQCALRNYESTRNLSAEAQADKLLPGHVLAKAHGPLLVGLGSPDEPAELRRGRIWEGGVSLTDRPLYLVMKSDDKSARVANAIADRLNMLFRDDDKHRKDKQEMVLRNQRLFMLDDVTDQLNHKFEGVSLGRGEVAKAMNKEMITLRVPYSYRLNPERYLMVARMVPLREDPKDQPKYRQRLQQILLDPQQTVRAAVRLEALGRESVSALKKGLESPHPLVRFASAEALAYLGNTAGIEELGKLAASEHCQPVRFYCLLAMANLDEAVCRNHLKELLGHPDVELRSGAFLALRLLDQADPRNPESRLNGQLLNECFWLHQVAPKSPPLVHFCMTKRAEVVLYGDDIHLVNQDEPIRILAGPEFTVTSARHDDRCTVSRFRAEGSKQKQCSLQLPDVIRTMGELGTQYADVVEFLRKAEERRHASCPIRFNAFPEQVSVETLHQGGRNPNFLKGIE